jgi:hypothetical protein
MISKPKHPFGDPMTLGNLRRLGEQTRHLLKLQALASNISKLFLSQKSGWKGDGDEAILVEEYDYPRLVESNR